MSRKADRKRKPGAPVRRPAAPTPLPAEAPASQPTEAPGPPAPVPREKRRIPLRPLAWTLGAALLSFSIYRVANFQLEPLDGPHTLRPYLLAGFNRFLACYRHFETAELHWLILCHIALLIPAALILWNFCCAIGLFHTRPMPARIACSRVTLFAFVAAALLVCRFPLLLKEASNPDEHMLLAAAHKLFFDPVYFRAVDCGTSGPLNSFPLMLPALVGISPDYATGRLIAILLIFASLYILYRAVAQVGADHVARMAILPGLGFFALVTKTDFRSYSSEHVSLLLVSLAMYACMRIVRDPRRNTWPLAWLGALAALAYFAKQQSVPIVAAAAAVALACVYVNRQAGRWWRPIALAAAGFAPLPLLNAWICAATGTWHDFLTCYVLGNIRYAQTSLKLSDELRLLAAFLPDTPEFKHLFLAFLVLCAISVYSSLTPPPKRAYLLFAGIGTVGTAVIGAFVWFVSSGGLSGRWLCAVPYCAAAVSLVFLSVRAFRGDRKLLWLGLLSTAVVAASAYSVYRAHHMFPHYILLVVIPLCSAMGWMLLRLPSSAQPCQHLGAPDTPSPRLTFALVICALFTGCAWHLLPSIALNFETYHPPTMATPAGNLIHSLTRPGPTLEAWGWYPALYLQSGRPPALRDATIGTAFVSDPGAAYYRRRFLREMRQYRPDMFVDARKPSCCFVADASNSFELEPSIKSYIDSDYIQVADRWDLRFFLRRDLAGLGSGVSCAGGALRCYLATAGPPVPLPPLQMPKHARIDAEFVPLLRQEDSALVFGNAPPDGTPRGFRFQSAGPDRYRLSVGAGGRWVTSPELVLPARRKVSLSIEILGKAVTIFCNGQRWEEMELPGAMSDAPEPISLGSGKIGDGFVGAINSFQIRDLDAHPAAGGHQPEVSRRRMAGLQCFRRRDEFRY